MFDSLSSRLDHAFKTLKGHSKLTELNIAESVKEIRRALVDADVSYKIAKDFTNKIKKEAIGQNVITSVSPGQLMTKIVNDELKELLGGETRPIDLSANPSVILIAGLQGSGKTTFSGKLSAHLKSKGKNPLLVACDVYRPAAINQIKVLGEQVGVNVFANEESKNPLEIAKEAVKFAKVHQHNVVIVDTAGRLSIDEAMMNEIGSLKNELTPQEILFVVDSMTGQDAVNTAKAFNDKLDFNGVVLTKLDGDTRGGAAISIKSVVNKPIKFVSTGEKMEALDVFHPDRMANRILGMGDIVSFVEKAQENFDQAEAAALQKKMRKNQFDFDDFLKQLNQIKKMGNIKDLMGMIPGVGKAIKNVDINDDSFKGVEAIIQSMTNFERQNPSVLDGSRKKRIALGSGTSTAEVNKLVKQFDEMRKMMKAMNKKGLRGGANLFKR
ncbi:MAG: signal recognition particle protein [Bacteroidia bacterium]|nr:signal recognition particle protein [Bacteroidia bacterium]MDG2041532.1 signal recognition particle protein [Bacteroidia bacterium]